MVNTLYIVPTPIGNLEDITLRALRILREVDLIAAEDTRNSHKLLEHYDITTPMTSYHEHNKFTKAEAIFEVLRAGGDVALISDAGTPGISDPGYELIQQAILANVTIVALPGASALITALVGSGLPTDRFTFFGFLPRKYQEFVDFLRAIADRRETLVFYESPNRLVESLHVILSVLGDRQAVVARELSKFYEEYRREPISKLIDHYTENLPKGEIVLVVTGNTQQAHAWNEEQVRQAMKERLAAGERRSTAAKIVAEQSGWDRRDIYNLQLD
jgi:16S rRNA (cytidine1402-2'-O)-methyltransferase